MTKTIIIEAVPYGIAEKLLEISNVHDAQKIISITIEYKAFDWEEIYKFRYETARLKYELIKAGESQELLEKADLATLTRIANEMQIL